MTAPLPLRLCLPFLILVCMALPGGARGLTLMVYNVENLFDDVSNGTEYREYDPAKSGWSRELFELRVQAIAEVVRKAVPGGADILALQEVESEKAARALADGALKDLGYLSVVFVPKKGLAANTAVLTRLPVSRVNALAIAPWKGEPLRDVIEVEITLDGRTLHLLNNHWKSKTGGARESEASRVESARVVNMRVREILAADPQADVIVAGDLNESVDERTRTRGAYQTALVGSADAVPDWYASSSIFVTRSVREAGLAGGRLTLYDPWLEMPSSRRGSYNFRGSWQTLDHALLSPGMFDERGFSYRPGGFSVLKAPFLLTSKGRPRGWAGLKGPKGYSDHLPLVVRLEASR